MLKAIFDTSIYGRLLEKKDFAIIKNLLEDKEFIIYGFEPIKKQIENTPSKLMLEKLEKKKILIELYNKLTQDRYLRNSIIIRSLAKKYHDYYLKLGGSVMFKNVEVDFTIIACASMYGLDVVVSDDKKTMLKKKALKSYKHINKKENLRSPDFWFYNDLKEKYS